MKLKTITKDLAKNVFQDALLTLTLNALLNSQNNRRALSRGEGKSIGFAD
jgi:hypothetical protein